jgi:hypothetical protein
MQAWIFAGAGSFVCIRGPCSAGWTLNLKYASIVLHCIRCGNALTDGSTVRIRISILHVSRPPIHPMTSLSSRNAAAEPDYGPAQSTSSSVSARSDVMLVLYLLPRIKRHLLVV